MLDVNGCYPKCLVPFGGFLSELLASVQVVRCGVAWSEACLVDGVSASSVGCRRLHKSWLKSSYKMGIKQMVRWLAMSVSALVFDFQRRVSPYSLEVPHLA